MTDKQPRGIRNNNPGNIEKGDPWQGLDSPGDDGRFCRFKAPSWGIRAIARILITYQDKHDIQTIEGAISRWAPEFENNTAAYIKHVAKAVGVRPDQPIDFHAHEMMRPMIETIILHENGVQPYSDAQIDKGLVLAGIEPPEKGLQSSRTIKGAQAAGIGVAGTAISDAASQLAPLADYSETIKWLFLAVAVIGISVTVYARLSDKNKGLR